MYEIDENNAAILNLLVTDGRMSAAEISKRLGNVSERAVRYRLDRMISERVVEICAIVDPKKLGYTVKADVFIEVEAAYIREVAQTLTEYECVAYVGCSIGGPDISIQVFAPDNATVFNFVTEVIATLPGVIKTKTVILAQILKDTHHWQVPNSPEEAFLRQQSEEYEQPSHEASSNGYSAD